MPAALPARLSHHHMHAFAKSHHRASLPNLNPQVARRGSAQPSLCRGMAPQKLLFVMVLDVVHDGLDQGLNAAEGAPSDLFVRDTTKPPFDQVQPRATALSTVRVSGCNTS